jgi:3-hydroxyisobutyryl-CoA hydrolase
MYAMPEGKIGFFTDVGAGYFLSRLRSNIGFYLGLTGARLKGEDVYLAGLAKYFIPR